MIFNGKIKKRYLYQFLYGIGAVVDECKLNIKPDGIYVGEVDPANVCLVDAKLPEKIFEEGYYLLTKPIVVGLDITAYLSIFKDDDVDDDCIISLNLLEPVEEGMPKLITVIDDKNSFFIEDVRYEHTTLNIESINKSPKIPNIDTPLEIIMDVELFKRGISAVDHIGDEHMCIGVNFNTEPTLFMNSYSDYNANRSCINIPVDHLPVFLNSDHGLDEIKSLYSMDYLKDIFNFLSKFGFNNNIRLDLGNDMPLLINTNFGEIGIKLKYILAPRIEDD